MSLGVVMEVISGACQVKYESCVWEDIIKMDVEEMW
jgi:hypothetical protein